MLREASWSRSNSSWGMSQFKRPNDILASSSGFDQRSMTISVSSRILEIAEGLRTILELIATSPFIETYLQPRKNGHSSRHQALRSASIVEIFLQGIRFVRFGKREHQ